MIAMTPNSNLISPSDSSVIRNVKYADSKCTFWGPRDVSDYIIKPQRLTSKRAVFFNDWNRAVVPTFAWSL